MRGRGLLIAAAVLQLVGAGLFLVSGLAQVAMGLADPRMRPVAAMAGIGAAVAIGYVVVSIALLGCRRWAWIASLALDGLSALALASAVVVGRVGLGELIILFVLVGAPLVVTIGLLVGGRHAVASTAAAAPPATRPGA
jgi:hypothetical protein